MDSIIQWLHSILGTGLPASTLAAVVGLGALVSTIVAFVRAAWPDCVGKVAIATVFGVSAITNLVVFAGAGLLDRGHVLYFLGAVVMVGLSAIGGNQVLKKAVIQ